MKKHTFRPVVEALEDLVLPASRFGGALTGFFRGLGTRTELASTQDQAPRLSGFERRQQVWNQGKEDDGGGFSILSGQAPVVGIAGAAPKFLTQTSSVTVGFTDADWPADPSTPYVVVVQWGDGQSSQQSVPHPVPSTFNHVYAATGVYTVTATVTDPSGNVGTATTQLIVATMLSLQWVAIDSPFDANPNPGGGLRIFPDKPLPDPNDLTDYKKVRLVAQVDQAVAGLTVHFRSYDVDDPTSNEAPVDNETEPADNRAGHQVEYLQAYTNSMGFAETIVHVSMQPGDNYRALATGISQLLVGVHPKQNDGTQARIEDAAGVVITNQHPLLKITDALLTTWRRLHVEVDSMGILLDQTEQTGVDPNDDFLLNGMDVPFPDTSELANAMIEAFVRVQYDVGDNNDNVQAFANVVSGQFPKPLNDFYNLIADHWTSKNLNANDFWVAYVLGAFQGPPQFDHDPDGEAAILGQTGNPTGGSLIYEEVIQDWTRRWNATHQPPDQFSFVTQEQDTVVHEVGHAVADTGGHPVTGLDAKTSGLPIGAISPDFVKVTHHLPSRYLPIYLHWIRQNPKPRGYT